MSLAEKHSINTAYYLEKAQEIGKIGTWDLDLLNNQLYWTKQNYIIFNVDPDTELTYELFLEKVHPDDKDFVNEKWTEALERKSNYNIEHRLLIDGKVKWVKEKCEFEFNEDGIAVRAVGVSQDITEQKRIEESLKVNQYYLEKAQEIGNIGTWDEDLVTKEISWTKQTYKIFELDESVKIVDGTIEEFIHPEDKDRVIDSWEKALEGEPYDIVYRIVVNEKLKWLKEKAEFEYNKEGNAVRCIGVTEDVTQMMEMGIALEEARKKAEESNQLKTAFLANVSHEIRTPLNGILGFADLLLKDSSLDNKSRQQYLEIIKSSGDNLLNIINDIIDISKIESNQLSIQVQVFDLHQLLNNIKLIILQSVGDKKIDIELEFANEQKEFFIESDPLRIQQVLLNLLSNAVKFTDVGTINFGYRTNQDQNTIQFYVNDSGIGISEQDLERIFKRFAQVKPKGGIGTGLGLSISKSLVEMMGGRINVSSEVGKGTNFTFRIPLRVINRIVLDPKKADLDKELTDKRILIVDDNHINCLYLYEVLSRNGMKPKKVHSGEAAIEECKSNDYDVVLMDVNMKGIDGYEAMKQIKTFKPDLPIIIQTGYAMREEEQKALNEGASNYISKPINIGILKNMISECL
ncbi:ATP-binding protein [Paracrocinitomix mangrovi]|uniref:hybrid sensor histidine kinase/response regulator n=1 Tax=Paracrocinitomix mangrovi TaxID=2862509 RepID=UPI001C8D09EA|nr:ATP-binding protein [Paracrocinitomix mangrovi]UKN01826.1 ATP-binding protein [Paracrocinitomix mangrovi]